MILYKCKNEGGNRKYLPAVLKLLTFVWHYAFSIAKNSKYCNTVVRQTCQQMKFCLQTVKNITHKSCQVLTCV